MCTPARLLGSILLLAAVFNPRILEAQGCSVPATYTHRATVTEGDLLVTLATDEDAYVVGTPVQIWLSFENTGSAPLSIPNPSMITPMQGVLILPASCDSLDEAGCSGYMYKYPFAVFFFGVPLSLAPGQCSSTQVIWDGVPPATQSVLPGLYTVFGGMNTGTGEFHAPPGGVRLPIQIQASASVPEIPLVTWGMLKSLYRSSRESSLP